jgi:hypothetical protein
MRVVEARRYAAPQMSVAVESRMGAVAWAIRQRSVSHPTGSPEAVARPRYPQNVAFARDVMGQRSEAEIWLPSSFHCYLFKFRFHGQLIFSLNRRPCLPLNGAHVAQEQFNYR